MLVLLSEVKVLLLQSKSNGIISPHYAEQCHIIIHTSIIIIIIYYYEVLSMIT